MHRFEIILNKTWLRNSEIAITYLLVSSRKAAIVCLVLLLETLIWLMIAPNSTSGAEEI